MKRLSFYPIYAAILRQRRKTTTLRIGNREGLNPGDIAQLYVGWDNVTAEPLHMVRILEVYRKAIGKLESQDLEGESPDCSTPEAAAMVVGCVYRKLLAPTDEVTIIKFTHLA